MRSFFFPTAKWMKIASLLYFGCSGKSETISIHEQKNKETIFHQQKYPSFPSFRLHYNRLVGRQFLPYIFIANVAKTILKLPQRTDPLGSCEKVYIKKNQWGRRIFWISRLAKWRVKWKESVKSIYTCMLIRFRRFWKKSSWNCLKLKIDWKNNHRPLPRHLAKSGFSMFGDLRLTSHEKCSLRRNLPPLYRDEQA